MNNKNLLFLTAVLSIILLMSVNAVTYSTPASVYANFDYFYNSDPVYNNFTNVVIGNYYTGKVDEIGFYGDNLTIEQVAEIWNDGDGVPYGGLGITILLISPEDNLLTNTTLINFSANISVVETKTIKNVTLEILKNDILYYTTTDTSGDVKIYEWDINIMQDGEYTWMIKSYDNENELYYSTIRTFTIDSISPEIDIISPLTHYDYLEDNQTLDLNYTITDLNGVDKCWARYQPMDIVDLDCNANTTFTYQYPYNNITIYANDTFGNIGNITRSWDVDLTYLGMDYQNETISTTSNPFSVKYAYDTNKFTGTMAYLNYSGTSYLMNSTANNSEITANKDLIIATSLPINYTFGFKVELARVGQSPITYSINNFTQLVKPIDLSLCNATQTSKYIQYNIFKEGTTTPLNASFEWTGSLWIDGDGTISQPFSYKDESENKSTFSFCTNYTEQNITTTGLVSYLRSDSDRRDYVLTNLLMTNQSQTINLFLLPINQSSIVTITLYDYNNNYIANGKINVLRWDIGTNTFSTVATLTTNQDGRTFVNLDLFNSYYKFVVTYQGRVILTTDPDRIGSTEISLRASLGSPSDYEPFRHITRDMTYNKNTHVVNFVWSDNSGAMARGCLVVYKNTPIGRQQVSRECSTSVSSILSYLATDNQTSYTAIGTIFLSSAYNSVYDDIVLNFEFGESIPSEIVGTKGYVLSFLLFGFIISATMATGMVMITAIGLPVAAWFVNMMGFLIIPNYIFITITSLSLLLIIMEAFKKK